MSERIDKMKEFISECLDTYAMGMVIIFWIPLMIICIPIAFVAVVLKTAYEVVSEMFGIQDE
jgi:hypothetical protein